MQILGEDLSRQLAMKERFDAMIDRAVKQFVNGKAHQPKKISASNRAEPQPSTQGQ